MNTKDQIIEAAKCSFALHGYEGTTLSQIAKEVGIQKPSIYNHFKSKNELYLYVAKMVIEALLVGMQDTYERHKNENLEIRLYLLFKNSCNFILNKQEGMMYVRFLLFRPVELKEEVKTILSRGDSQIEDIVNKFYTEGIEEGQFRDPKYVACSHKLAKLMFIPNNLNWLIVFYNRIQVHKVESL
uniref:TetR/AcrR family transcriptional regulator n=1 Tax=Niallia sp. XMNu-256 TaxID=3082444 RepID=UPI00403F2D4D